MSIPKVFSADQVEAALVVRPLRCVGSLVEDNARNELDEVLDQLDQSEIANVVVDFCDVEYFGTTMLEAVHILWRRAREREGRMVLCNTSDMVREILHVSGFEALWTTYPTRDDALRAVSK